MKFLKNIPLRFWVISASILIIFVFSWFSLLNSFELLAYDIQMRLRPAIRQAGEIVIIEIDDSTLKGLGEWPLKRDAYADLVYVLKKCGARSIILDLLFSEPTENDIKFAQSVKQAANVYMALAFEEPKGLNAPQVSSRILNDLLKPLRESALGVGHINTRIDFDGKTRSVPLFIKYEGQLVPQLALKAACDYLGLNSGDVSFTGESVIIGRKLILPVLPDGSIFVNYPARWKRSFKHYSYVDLMRAYMEAQQGQKADIDLSSLENKVCIIGLTATATTDIRPNPLERLYPMVGLQASIFNSIITGQFIRPAGRPANVIFSLFVFIIALFICLRSSPLKAFGISMLLCCGCLLISMGLFVFFRVWVDIFLQGSIIIITYIGSTLYRFFNEIKKRLLLEKELDIARAIQKSFLPKDLKEFSGISISSFMQPAKFVAGDLYDIVIIQDKKVGVFIGDVSGKGVPASLIMAQTISLFRVFANQYSNASEVLNRLNKELYGKFEGRFVTGLYMIIDPAANKVQVSSAGHAPVLLYSKDENKVSEVELGAGMPLGILEENVYGDVSFDLGKNDKVMIFTDGLTEARNLESEEFGLDAVKKIIFEHGSVSSDKILKAAKDELSRFTLHAAQFDDITIIVLANHKEE